VRAALPPMPARRAAPCLVLDADALTSSRTMCRLARLIRQSGKDVVLTPHDGEFARLFGHAGKNDENQWASLYPADQTLPSLVAALQSDSKTRPVPRRRRVERAAVILKAPIRGRRIAKAWQHSRGFAAMDRGGSGDVLRNDGRLLAQSHALFEAASAAVWRIAPPPGILGRASCRGHLKICPRSCKHFSRGNLQADGS